MTIVGKVDSLWRYPVKSMRGEELAERLQVTREFTATASSPSKVQQARAGFRISRRASSGDFCNIGPGFVILTKPRSP